MTAKITYTVTMDAELAQIVGIPAAMLYNLLLWYSDSEMVKDYDKDGWFYFTANQFEEKTTFNQNTFTKAANTLVKFGLIDKKRMYVKYGQKESSRSVSHFRIKSSIRDFQITRNVSTTHTKCDLYIKEEKKEEKRQITENSDLGSSETSFGASQAEPARASTPIENEPFGEEVKRRSVRPSQKDDGERKRMFAIANNVRKRLGLKGSADVAYKQGIKRWLEAGLTEDDIVKANELMERAHDGYHETLTPLGRLSANSMDWYQQQKKKDPWLLAENNNSEYNYPPVETDENGYPVQHFDYGI